MRVKLMWKTVIGAIACTLTVAPQTAAQTGGAATVASQAREAEPILRLYLARHGQTDWNVEGKLQGSVDIPLNATGREQAGQLRRRLVGVQLDAVYSSELRRSRETAEIARGSVPLTPLAGLNERRLGVFQGHPGTAEYERRSRDPDDTLDGGESLAQFFARVRTALDGILARHRSGAILIVGHGGTNQMIVRALFGLSAEQAASFQQGNDELYLCDLASGTPVRFWKLVAPVK
jgi:probable phosphoglycerate mutase